MSVAVISLLTYIIGCSDTRMAGVNSNGDSTAGKTGNECLGEARNKEECPTDPGSYDGDPIVYKANPNADPKNKYKYYTRAPAGVWYVNKTKPADPSTVTIATSNTTPSRTTYQTIGGTPHPVSTGQIKQVAPAPAGILGPVAQRGRAAGHTPGGARADQTFLSNNRGMVDILLVMDNSGSMYQEGQYIRHFLPELMKHIWRSDWRIGMTNSSGSKCTVTTLTAQQAGNKNNEISYRLDRDSMNYQSFHDDLNKYKLNNMPAPRYLAPYYYHYTSTYKFFERSDYRWASPCGYNITGASCTAALYQHLKDYHNDKKRNPLKYYFSQEGLNIFTTDATAPNSGDERMLTKVRWVLEGKAGTTCEGWARDQAMVVAIVITDEGHNCADADHAYCSIDSYKKFAANYGSSRKFKTYGILSSALQSDRRTYLPQWQSDELTAFDGYVVSYNDRFEGGGVKGYFDGLSNGYQSYAPPTKLPSSHAWHNRLTNSYGHRPLHLLSMTIADELRNIYSPLAHVPDQGTAEVKVASYIENKQTQRSEYKFGIALDPCGTQGLSATDPCYVVHNDQKAFELVQHGNMSHFDKQVKIAYNYGGSSTPAVPFDSDWTLSFAPDPASVVFSVTLKDGTTNVLTRGSDYSVAGAVVSVQSSRVQQLVPEGSSVTITYRAPLTLTSSWTLDPAKQLPAGAALVSNTVQVLLIDADGNEGKWQSTGFTFNGRVISFQPHNIPVAGGGFSLRYNYEVVTTDYDYTRNKLTDSSTPLVCSSGGTAVSCSHDPNTNKITFTDTSQFRVGDSIRIVETLLPDAGSGVTIIDHALPDNYVEAKGVSASAGGQSCSTTDGSIRVVDGIIKFSEMTASCGIFGVVNKSSDTQVSLTYHVYEDLADDFLQMDSSFFAKHRGKYKFEWWEVLIGGTAIDEFVLEDYRITELDGVMTDDEDGLLTKFDDDTKIKVVVRLYHAL